MKSNVLLIGWAHLKIFLEGGGERKKTCCQILFLCCFVISCTSHRRLQSKSAPLWSVCLAFRKSIKATTHRRRLDGDFWHNGIDSIEVNGVSGTTERLLLSPTLSIFQGDFTCHNRKQLSGRVTYHQSTATEKVSHLFMDQYWLF